MTCKSYYRRCNIRIRYERARFVQMFAKDIPYLPFEGVVRIDYCVFKSEPPWTNMV